ncbi:MAG: cupin domain-containing protein [Hyphomicrobiaceae bacterium]|nr:cupin domain-containing protein [Hyphomicrobiaceae bacterium]
MTPPTRVSPADAAAVPLPAGRLSAELFSADGIEIRYYAPKGTDTQAPHDRDEFYFVIAGSGTFERNGEAVPFRPGDMLFAAAGETHRFTGFSPDFATWVLFYGPKMV